MCIIAIKPKGVNLPKKKILQRCYDNNNEGAGFAYARGGMITLKKGYFDFEKFYSDVSQVKQGDGAVLHFRIAVCGGAFPMNCHPFVISQNKEELTLLDGKTLNPVIVHNGVVESFRHLVNNDTKKLAYTLGDKKILPYIFDNQSIKRLIGATLGSGKLAILNRFGKILTWGDFEKDGGMIYSNYGFKWDFLYTQYGNIVVYDSKGKLIGYDKVENENIPAEEVGDGGFGYDTLPKKDKNGYVDSVAVREPCDFCGAMKRVRYYFDLESNICDDCVVDYKFTE